jgi:hypothetical protein
MPNTWQVLRRLQGRREEQRIERLRQALRRPGRELVLQHRGKRGHEYRISPDNIPVRDEDAATLIRRRYVRERSPGLFSDQPQSWTAN